jgi:parallel beta-helix repeat protein
MLLSVLVCCVFSASFPRIKTAAWTGVVHINADGTIDPLAAPIQRNGDVYTLTGNITSDTDGIWIQRNNMTLDGSGYTIQGSAAQDSAGILMRMVSNMTIKNVRISAFSKCISFEFSSNNSVRANEIRAAEWEGIWVYGSSNNSITGNNIAENTAHTAGVWLTNFSEDNEVAENTITDCGNGILISVSDNRISRNNVTSNGNGIWLQDTSNITITENTLAENEYGIWVEDSSNNTICHNSFVNNQHQVQTYGNVNVWDNVILLAETLGATTTVLT